MNHFKLKISAEKIPGKKAEISPKFSKANFGIFSKMLKRDYRLFTFSLWKIIHWMSHQKGERENNSPVIHRK